MAPQTAAQQDQIREAARLTNDAQDQIRTLQSQLEGAVLQLRNGWAGQSGMAFQRVHEGWNSEMTVVLAKLLGLGQKLKDTAGVYQATEQNQEAAALRLNASINL